MNNYHRNYAKRINVMKSSYSPGIYGADSFAKSFSDRFSEMVHQLLKDSFQLPFTEIEVNGLPRAKFLEKHSPLTGGLSKVQHSICHFT